VTSADDGPGHPRRPCRGFDIAKATGGANRAVVREFNGVQVQGELDISLSASKGRTLLCGVEIIAR
jgi:hypothetical protein